MSRPSRLLLPAACAFLSLGFSACVGTIYDRTYSYKKSYFKAPEQQKEASAEDILGAVTPTTPTMATPDGLPPAGMPTEALPPPAGDIPGLPPAMPADPAAAPMGLPPL